MQIGLDWFFVCAILPMALPLLVISAFAVFGSRTEPLHAFVGQGDFLLATTVLAAAVGYDLSEAIRSGQLQSDWRIYISHRALWVFAGACSLYYAVLKTILQFNPGVHVPRASAYVGVAVYVCISLLSLGVKSVLYAKGAEDE